MRRRRLRKVGRSAVPLDGLRLQAGLPVGVTVESGSLVVEAQERPRYSMDELLAQCDVRARAKRDRSWVAGERTGGEMI